MVRRLAAVSALVWAGLVAAPAAQAQGFFSFYETSPRDVVDRLYDQGYTVHLPMVRRGDVYVVDAVSASRRPMRLIVSARDGHVVERYATAPRWSDEQTHGLRWRDDEGDRDPYDPDAPRWERRTRTALGEAAAPPRDYERDGDFGVRPVPPAPIADDPDKPKRHAKKHAPAARDVPDILPKSDAPVAAVSPSDVKPAKVEPGSPARVIEIPQAKATDRPEPKPSPEARPSPEPTSQAKGEDRPAPRVIPLTKPAPEGMPSPHQAPAASAKVEEAPGSAPKPSPKPSPSAQAHVEEKAKTEAAPPAAKSDAPRKKLNDLPVGTLD